MHTPSTVKSVYAVCRPTNTTTLYVQLQLLKSVASAAAISLHAFHINRSPPHPVLSLNLPLNRQFRDNHT